jgi:peptidoglycan/xylan/chitin deacetylase (PgdA/CDA1 family)
MKYLRSLGYRTCEPDLAAAEPLPGTVAITFDDAYESVFESAYATMREFGFLGMVFVVTGYAGRANTWDVNLGSKKWRHMSWSQMREMADSGFAFGSHSRSHADLTRLAPELLREELVCSKETIEDKLGRPCLCISYPFGRTNGRVKSAARNAGYRYGFVITPRENGDDMEIGRMGIYITDLLFDFRAKLGLSGPLLGRAEAAKVKLINSFSLCTAVVKRPALGLDGARAR